ncbi:hypothetical protein [Agromyces agglutinans]|uniref:hypothetical protein n=1 Tax=Agromyces agglutinans TaxID=2662258 RepID=UPI001C12AB34|nr:hypothetical protein [Agromyces agglutinans]
MSAPRPSAAVALIVPTLALVASVVVTVLGALWTVSANALLTTALSSETGTAAEVYGSQSAIVISSGLLTAGVIGIILSLVLFGALIGFGALSKPVEQNVSDLYAADFDDEVDLVEAEPVAQIVPEQPAAAPAAPAAAPATPAAPAAPAAAPAAPAPADAPAAPVADAPEAPEAPAPRA